MKAVMLILACLLARVAFGYTSGIAISTGGTSVIQVFVNGKLCNKSPEKYVRIKAPAGTFHVRVKLLNIKNGRWQEWEQTISIDRGFEHQFTVVQPVGKTPQLTQIKRYPIYSEYYLNYSLYIRQKTA